jgi:hypothetical protein
MEAHSSDKANALAERNDWSLAYAEGYVDGEQSRESGEPPSQYALVGFDEYSLGYRAGYFERQGSSPKHGPYWRYTRANGWVVRDPKSTAVVCPQCKSRAFRISRRFIDRVISVILPVRRYQCESTKCRWEGNLPINPGSKIARIAANLKRPLGNRSRRSYGSGRNEAEA